jgi:O-antigen/teichoic acid export membrane protein
MVAVGTISSSALAALLTTILGRELGEEGFGTYAFVIATAGLVAAVARVGLGAIVVRDVARSAGDISARAGSRQPIVTAIAITTFLSLVLALLTISPLGTGVLTKLDTVDRGAVGALAVLSVAQAIYIINGESLRALHYLGSAAILSLPTQRLISLTLVASAVYLVKTDLEPTGALWLTAIAAGVALAASGSVLWARIRNLPGGALERRIALRMTRDGAPVLLTNVLGLSSTRLPVWVLAALGSLDEAGSFALATAFVALIRLAHKTMISTLAPFVATAYHSGSRKELQGRMRVAAAATSTMAIIGAATLLVVGSAAVPRLFGDGDFANVVPVAGILLIGTISVVLGGPSGLLLNVTGNERWMARASVISTAVAAALIYPVAARGGALGAAAVMAATTTLRVTLQVVYAKRHTGLITYAHFPALVRSLRRGVR